VATALARKSASTTEFGEATPGLSSRAFAAGRGGCIGRATCRCVAQLDVHNNAVADRAAEVRGERRAHEVMLWVDASLGYLRAVNTCVGATWILTGCGTALGIAGGCETLGILPRTKLAAQTVGGLLGLPLTTYTAALVANTAVPIWHEARRELPFVFAGSAAASAGAAAAITTPPEEAGPARWMAVGGALMELSASRSMEKRLGQLLAEPYRQGSAGRFAKLAAGCTAGGAAVVAFAGRSRWARWSAAGSSSPGR
jgi:hypothetical protein